MRAGGAPQPPAYARVSAATQSVLLTALGGMGKRTRLPVVFV
jgi:hypothetical protein